MGDDYELEPITVSAKMSKQEEQSQASQHGSFDRDEADLMRLGKKPVLKVSVCTRAK